MPRLFFLFILFYLVLCPLFLHGQSIKGREKQPGVEGHAKGDRSGSSASSAIRNERKSKGSSFIRLEWLLGPSPVTRAEKYSRSSTAENQDYYMPPKSNSIDPGFYPRRARVNYTTNAGFVRNNPTNPLRPSRRQRQLAVGSWDIGALFGTSHSITDMQNNKSLGFAEFVDYHTGHFNFSFGVFTRFQAADWYAVSSGLKYAYFEGMKDPDSDIDFESPGNSFENKTYEFFIKNEFYAPFLYYNASDLYLFTGVTVFYANVELMDDGQSLELPGDFEPIQPALAFGIGYSYNIYNSLKIGYEFGWRYTLFNYIDGVSSINHGYDSYFFNLITVSYPLSL